jgi:hypothetical protein
MDCARQIPKFRLDPDRIAACREPEEKAALAGTNGVCKSKSYQPTVSLRALQPNAANAATGNHIDGIGLTIALWSICSAMAPAWTDNSTMQGRPGSILLMPRRSTRYS